MVRTRVFPCAPRAHAVSTIRDYGPPTFVLGNGVTSALPTKDELGLATRAAFIQEWLTRHAALWKNVDTALGAAEDLVVADTGRLGVARSAATTRLSDSAAAGVVESVVADA